MPASDYTSTVSGGLKLKGGAKDSGIKKKKKSSSSSKKKSALETPAKEGQGEGSEATKPAAGDDDSSTALALSTTRDDKDEDDEEGALRRRSRSSSAVPGNPGTGKTEAQRRHEEIKRKRVSGLLHTTRATRLDSSFHCSTSLLLGCIVRANSFYSSTSDSGAKAGRKRTSSEWKS